MIIDTLPPTARFSCYLRRQEIEALDADRLNRTRLYHSHHDCETLAVIKASRVS